MLNKELHGKCSHIKQVHIHYQFSCLSSSVIIPNHGNASIFLPARSFLSDYYSQPRMTDLTIMRDSGKKNPLELKDAGAGNDMRRGKLKK
jgi:hypothetical protein